MTTFQRLFLMFAATALMCFAQLNRGTVTGLIADPSGAVVPGAVITAKHVDTGTSAATVATGNGNYTLPALPIGIYRMEYSAPGFKRIVRDQVSVTAGATLRLDIVLEIGSLGETVEVQAQSSPVEAETTRVATTINTKLVGDLPLFVNGSIRSVLTLALIAPETKTAGGFRIGGGQGAGWEMMMDGMPTTSASTQYQTDRAPLGSVPIDAINEFTVESSGMKAEFGRASGAVTFETKSGTNQVHGNLFEELRNNALDAAGFFAKQPPILKQHDFGFTAGGPVYIPKIYNGRNRTFFFASYQGFRNRAGRNPNYQTVPLPENYEGDFRGWTRSGKMVPIYDPATTQPNPNGAGYVRTVFPDNIIPKAQFSKVASRYIALRPSDMLPNVTGRNAFGDPVQNFFRDAGSTVNPWNKGSIKVDHQLTAEDRLSFLYLKGQYENLFGSDGPPGLPVPFNGGSQNLFRSTSARVTWDHMFGARIINSFRVAYQKESQWLATLNSLNPDDKWNEKLQIPNTPGPDQALPALSFTAYTGWSGSSWGGDGGGNFNLANDITFVRSTHTIKTGFFYTHDRWDGFGQHRPNGSYSFSYQATGVPGDTSQNSGNAFASFLLGYVSGGGIETPRLVRQIWNYMGGYVQDDWKVRPNLTINLGLRYEYTMPIHGGAYTGLSSWEDLGSGTLDGFSNFDPSAPNPRAGGLPGAVVFSGSGEGRLNRSVFDGYPWAFGPRVGIVYRAGAGFVIRASGGRTFAAVKTTGGSTHFDGFILNTNYNSADNSINDFWTMLDKGVPWGDKGLPPSAKSLPFVDPTLANDREVYFWQRNDSGRPGTYDMWTLDIQKQLSGSTALTVGYSGSKGTHLSSGLDRFNQITMETLQKYGRTLLNSSINSTGARNAKIPIPYAGFGSSTAHTVQRALSPFPQYTNIITNGGQPASIGERAGNSTYHALVMKLDRRFSSGLSILASYVFSKQFSDADSALIGASGALDHYNKKLEKSLSSVDQTHVARLAFTYDLPVGKGKRLGLGPLLEPVLGNWTLSSFLSYESGTPDSVASGANPIGTGSRVFITSYENWRAPIAGEKFDPNVDLWYDKTAFNQGISTERLNSEFGNATRNNPKLRNPWNLNENVALGKTFRFKERIGFQIRGEAFNLFNRVRWGGATSGVTSTSFGRVTTQGNTPRRMQIGLRLNF